MNAFAATLATPSTIGLPITGQPDSRTIAQKAARLNLLRCSVLGREIMDALVSNMPSALLAGRFLYAIGANEGYKSLLLSFALHRNPELLNALAARLPRLHTALRMLPNVYDPQQRFHQRHRAVKSNVTQADEHTVKLFLRDFFNGHLNIRVSCSGCFLKNTRHFSDGPRNFCRACTFWWFKASSKYISKSIVF